MKACSICGKPVRLSPSAAERARQTGGFAADYTALFPDHADCVIKKRQEETDALMRRHKERAEELSRKGLYPFKHP